MSNRMASTGCGSSMCGWTGMSGCRAGDPAVRLGPIQILTRRMNPQIGAYLDGKRLAAYANTRATTN